MSQTTVKDAIIQLRELLADPARWCTGSFALTSEGKIADPLSNNAVKWCLLGGTEKVARNTNSPPYYIIREALAEAFQTFKPNAEALSIALAFFNDKVQHKEVLEFLDHAIKTCAT